MQAKTVGDQKRFVFYVYTNQSTHVEHLVSYCFSLYEVSIIVILKQKGIFKKKKNKFQKNKFDVNRGKLNILDLLKGSLIGPRDSWGACYITTHHVG